MPCNPQTQCQYLWLTTVMLNNLTDHPNTCVHTVIRLTPSIGVLWPWIRFVPTRSSNNRSCSGWQSTNESHNRWGPVDRCQVFQNEHYRPRSAPLYALPLACMHHLTQLCALRFRFLNNIWQLLAMQIKNVLKQKKRKRTEGLFDGCCKNTDFIKWWFPPRLGVMRSI